MVLNEEGYDVSTAADGFNALSQLRETLPDIIISDLNMPRMSGFELLTVVRARFPQIPVIAMSGAYDSIDHFPDGLFADAVYPKVQCRAAELEQIVADLIRATVNREYPLASQPAPAQVPVFRNDSGCVLSMRLACTECLRTFSAEAAQEVRMEIQEAHCAFCAAPVRYVSRFSLVTMLRKVFEEKEAVNEEAPWFARMGRARFNSNARRMGLVLAHRSILEYSLQILTTRVVWGLVGARERFSNLSQR
jgi:CheY-like chemotaxis protein